MNEMLLSIHRAGADVIDYLAKEFAQYHRLFGIKLYHFGWMAVGLSIGMLSMAQPTNVRLRMERWWISAL